MKRLAFYFLHFLGTIPLNFILLLFAIFGIDRYVGVNHRYLLRLAREGFSEKDLKEAGFESHGIVWVRAVNGVTVEVNPTRGKVRIIHPNSFFRLYPKNIEELRVLISML